MQTQTQIRQILDSAGLAVQKRFGQCFLVDHNLMGKLIALADVKPGRTILEVGPGTGSLTEELLVRADKVAAVEIDRGLARLLREKFADKTNLALIEGDVMSGKHRISDEVMAAVAPSADLVSNLPYNIATPLIAECLASSWRAMKGTDKSACLFESLTFTVQREVADRLTARPGEDAYGPISVLAALTTKATPGPIIPAEAFWPSPKVSSRIVRLDFDSRAAGSIEHFDRLANLLVSAFSQRRKQIGSLFRRKGHGSESADFESAIERAGIAPAARPGTIGPDQFLRLADTAGGQFEKLHDLPECES